MHRKFAINKLGLEEKMSAWTSIGAIALSFAAATGWLYFLSVNLPSLSSSEAEETDSLQSKELHFPKDLEDLSETAEMLKQYRADHFGYITLLFCSAYLYKQTFAIPGSVFMSYSIRLIVSHIFVTFSLFFVQNLLGGAIFGVWTAFPLCCVLSAVGASSCFLLSKFFGRVLVMKFFAEKLEPLQKMVTENLESLFFFLLSIRIFPMTPNWFINMAAPILDVPLIQFFFSVLIGLMPYNFVCVQTGSILTEISSVKDVMTTSIMVKFGAVAVVMLLPGILAKKVKQSRSKNS
ncbi:Transmembrane protein 41A [Holothuria leucospilota]|uniref:Transmembrane protein 41A n=1 Tax=Holothuria leucospilota TaxID=206669 RepID=A0A9Q1BBX8_HOLLE|nr:Transmembrane protein 41A [Holothuria leucospilota]